MFREKNNKHTYTGFSIKVAVSTLIQIKIIEITIKIVDQHVLYTSFKSNET